MMTRPTKIAALAAMLIFLGSVLAFGDSTTFVVKDGQGTLLNFGATRDGSLTLYGNQALVDGTNAANKATVTAGGALKVDGSAATQPVSGTVATTPPSNASTNVAQINGVVPLMGNGGTGTGSPRVTISSDNTAFAVNNTQQGTASQNLAQFGGSTVVTGTGAGGAGIPRFTISNDSSLAANQSTNVNQIAGTSPVMKASGTNAATTDASLVIALSPNPTTVCTSVKAVNQTASTDLVTSVNKLHICSIVLVSATAQNISLVEGTGATCATGIAALIGGTTASVAVAANGGFASTSDRAWLLTQTTADHLCLLQSGVGNVSGIITYLDHN